MKKTVLITGCSSGIGYACVPYLMDRGYHVFASARKTDDLAHLSTLGCDVLRLDLNESTSINQAFESLLNKTNGHLDALVNNAGFAVYGALEDLSRDALISQFQTNVFGLMELSNLAIKTMRAQGHGRIVNVSSVLGIISLAYRGAYNASKYALEGLSDTLRLELHGSGISVSLINPGPIASHFRENAGAVFKTTVQLENSQHQRQYQRLLFERVTKGKPDPFTLPPTAVAKKVWCALKSKHPKAHYYVTVPTYTLATAKRILPTRALDWILRQITAKETK